MRWIPNLLSFVRLICAPVVGYLVLSNHQDWALYGIILAFSTDWLDGWLARLFHWETSLGQFLDPLADKVLTFSIFTALAFSQKLPWSLYSIVILRDVCIGVGFWLIRYRKKTTVFQPLRISKWNTAIQALLCTTIIWGKHPILITFGIYFLWVTTVFSFVMYGIEMWKIWE